MAPVFSIAMATYNRGRHIVPSIRSVLAQSFGDYELLIVGDGCDDDTEAAVRPFLSDRVIWRNLPQRGGHQTYPNNAAIEMARGRYIAYLGHDDLWAPDHLARLHRVFAERSAVAVAVSGCVCYGLPGSGHHMMAGMFEGALDTLEEFFPPSSVAHNRDIVARIGPWRPPETIKATADADFLLRAKHAGIPFLSTGAITAHKFATSHGRYLSYLRQESDEQEQLLRMMAQPGFPAFVSEVVARAHEIGMGRLPFPDFEKVAAGAYTAAHRASKGLTLPPLAMLQTKTVIQQDRQYRGLDWRGMLMRGKRPCRWSGPNPKPKLLVPVASQGPAELRFKVLGVSDPGVFKRLSVRVNGRPVSWTFRRPYDGGTAIVRCCAPLNRDRHSVVEFDLTGGASLEELVRCVRGRPERIALGDVSVRPVSWTKRLWPFGS